MAHSFIGLQTYLIERGVTTLKMMSKIKQYTQITAISMCVLFVGYFISANNVNAGTVIKVYKSATCGCCNKWINYMQKSGFSIQSVDVNDMDAVKQHYQIPKRVTSCHTAIVDGYVIEGHVPANDVKKLLSERKDVLGLAVPGMPVGSPGMEMGSRLDRYAVITFDDEGNVEIFHQY